MVAIPIAAIGKGRTIFSLFLWRKRKLLHQKATLKRRKAIMIILTKLNDVPFVLNCDLIETITENPDTTIRLTTDKYHIVKESMDEVVKRVVQYKRGIYLGERNLDL